MIGAAIFVYLGLVILGALPSPLPPAAVAVMGDLFSDYVAFWRAYDLGPRTAHVWPYLGWGMIAVGALRARRLLLLLRYAYWLRWLLGFRTFGNARIARRSDCFLDRQAKGGFSITVKDTFLPSVEPPTGPSR